MRNNFRMSTGMKTNEYNMQHMKRNGKTTCSRRRQHHDRRTFFYHRVIYCCITAASSSLARKQSSARPLACPPRLTGWAPSSDCKSYFWCSNGVLASIPYECTHGLLFDSKTSQCIRKYEVDCNANAAASSDIFAQAGGKNIPLSTPPPPPPASMPSKPTPPPSPRPSSFGDAIYFMDFPSRTCRTTNKPMWVDKIDMFTNKEECCEHLDWVPLQNCLGRDFVETNLVWEPTGNPTWSPTLSLAPSATPTKSPSASPSRSPTRNPTKSPTEMPTNDPSRSPTPEPTGYPTLDPTQYPTGYPTMAPFEILERAPTNYYLNSKKKQNAESYASSPVSYSAEVYLVDLLHWAGDQGTHNPLSLQPESYASSYQDYLDAKPETLSSSHHNPQKHTSQTSPKPRYPKISELILQVMEDATISKLSPNANFGSHKTLAVDGGSSEGDKYESLLKFDTSLLMEWPAQKQQTIASVTLRLHSRNGCSSGGILHAAPSDWTKDTITWNTVHTRPEYDVFPALGRLGSVTSKSWHSVDITSFMYSSFPKYEGVYGDFLTIHISSDEASRCLYSSMENGETSAPRLIVKYGKQPKHISAAGSFASPSSSIQPKSRPLSLSSSPTPPPIQGDFIMLRATDDATIMATYPLVNLGAEPDLRLAFEDASFQRDIVDTIIQFNLSELQHTVPRSAVLSLFAETDCVSAGTFTIAANKEWKESTVNWSTAPVYTPQAGDGNVVGTFGSVQAGYWHGFTMTDILADAVHSRKEQDAAMVTFRITSGDFHPCRFSSRNGGRAPKLMVTF